MDSNPWRNEKLCEFNLYQIEARSYFIFSPARVFICDTVKKIESINGKYFIDEELEINIPPIIFSKT